MVYWIIFLQASDTAATKLAAAQRNQKIVEKLNDSKFCPSKGTSTPVKQSMVWRLSCCNCQFILDVVSFLSLIFSALRFNLRKMHSSLSPALHKLMIRLKIWKFWKRIESLKGDKESLLEKNKELLIRIESLESEKGRLETMQNNLQQLCDGMAFTLRNFNIKTVSMLIICYWFSAVLSMALLLWRSQISHQPVEISCSRGTYHRRARWYGLFLFFAGFLTPVYFNLLSPPLLYLLTGVCRFWYTSVQNKVGGSGHPENNWC